MRNNRVKFVVNILIVLIVLFVVLYLSLKDDYQEIIGAILHMDHVWIIGAIMLFCAYRVFSGFATYNLVKANQEHIDLLKAIQISFIILFFHGVTPFAGGGQPMEVYYLHKEGISITKSTNIVLQNFIVYQVALVLVGILALVYNYCFSLFPSNSFIKKLVILGFVINMLVLVVTFMVSFGKRINKFILNQGLNLVGKLKLIRDVDKTRDKLNKYLHNFYKNALLLKRDKKSVFFNVLVNILGLLFLYSVPYAVVCGLGIHTVSIVDTMVSTAYIMTIGSFVPIPGGTGGLEYGFIFFFGHFIKGSVLNASMLVWRFITYYLGMIMGAVCLSLYRKKGK